MTTDDTKTWLSTASQLAVVALLVLISINVRAIENQMGTTPAPAPAPGPSPSPSPAPTPKPTPEPVLQTPLVKAGHDYHFGASAEYASIRDQIKSGSIKTAQQIADFMAAAARPFGDQIKVTVAANCDSKGNITNPSILAAEFDALSRSLEVK
jgi:hypothetical protein